MATSLKIYDGSTDPDDHVTRFVGAAKQREWQMPVWCRMFQQTLDGPTRGWFDRLPNGCVDNWTDLREKFVERKVDSWDSSIGSEGIYRRMIMKFTVVRVSSPYNIILGRTGMRELRAVLSTIHAMMKFPTLREIATLVARTTSVFKYMPFFKTLKNITKESKDEYRWTEDAERAFQEMKKLIIELTSLTTPILKETLYVYLATS
ncbi:hypothetical protein Tco_0625730 [Tanacetum coccineum]|uniref:Reverse transcriptase domain-containing protein n=1 Tax=Tanacetum coccineum TaxID=301880 RepID=A0ABQ4WHN3_9ASTR